MSLRRAVLSLVAISLTGTSRGAFAEEPLSGATVEETPAYETTVTASRRHEIVFESPRAESVVDGSSIENRASRTSPEAILETAGVFLQRSNYGGGAPVIRGQTGNRVLLLVDGIRLNNGTTRSGPNQFLNTVDPLLAERIEVLRGTGSAVHGSDALGGVVNVVSEQPHPGDQGGLGGELQLRGATFDDSVGVGGRARWSNRTVGAVVTGSRRHFGDLRAGAESPPQRFNGYDEWSGSAAFGWSPNDNRTYLGGSLQTTQQYDVQRSFGSNAQDFRVFTLQNRTLAYLRFTDSGLGGVQQLRVTASYHRQGEQFERYRIARDSRQREDTRVETFGLQIEDELDLGRGGILMVGGDLFIDKILTLGFVGKLSSDELQQRRELSRYVPGVGYLHAAAFINHAVSLGERFRLVSELRLGAVRTSLPKDDRLALRFPAEGIRPLEASTDLVPVYGGGLHGRYALTPRLAAYAGASLAFRAPNLDDYSRIGAEGTGYVVPTRGLRPEKALSGELGLKYSSSRAEASLAYAYTYVFDAMTRVPTTIGARETLDGALIQRVANGESSRFHSAELSGRLPLWRRLELFGNATYTHGLQFRHEPSPEPGEPGRRIIEPTQRLPPPFGLVGVGWYARARSWFAEGLLRVALAQTRLNALDLADTRICPAVPGRCTGTPAWATVGVRAGLSVSEYLRLTVVGENLFNTTYRMHGSGLDGPGRGVVLMAEGRLP